MFPGHFVFLFFIFENRSALRLKELWKRNESRTQVMLSRCHRPGAPGSRGGATPRSEGTHGSCHQAGLRSRPEAPPEAACPGQEAGSEVVRALDGLRACQPGGGRTCLCRETGRPAGPDGQHADLPCPPEPWTGGVGRRARSGGRWGRGHGTSRLEREEGLQAGRAQSAGGRSLGPHRQRADLCPPEAVRPCVCVLQSDGIGDHPRTPFYLSHLFKDSLHIQPCSEVLGASAAHVAPGRGDAVRPRTGHVTRPEAQGLGRRVHRGVAGAFLGVRFRWDEVRGLH